MGTGVSVAAAYWSASPSLRAGGAIPTSEAMAWKASNASRYFSPTQYTFLQSAHSKKRL